MKDLQRRLVVLVSGLLLLAAAFVSYRAGERFESSLTQQRLGVETEIGRSVAVVSKKPWRSAFRSTSWPTPSAFSRR
jgi:ATP/ADP translocase